VKDLASSELDNVCRHRFYVLTRELAAHEATGKSALLWCGCCNRAKFVFQQNEHVKTAFQPPLASSFKHKGGDG